MYKAGDIVYLSSPSIIRKHGTLCIEKQIERADQEGYVYYPDGSGYLAMCGPGNAFNNPGDAREYGRSLIDGIIKQEKESYENKVRELLYLLNNG